jgi:hypothetical protein
MTHTVSTLLQGHWHPCALLRILRQTSPVVVEGSLLRPVMADVCARLQGVLLSQLRAPRPPGAPRLGSSISVLYRTCTRVRYSLVPVLSFRSSTAVQLYKVQQFRCYRSGLGCRPWLRRLLGEYGGIEADRQTNSSRQQQAAAGAY